MLVCQAEDLVALGFDVELEVVTTDDAHVIVANMEDDAPDVTTVENKVQYMVDDNAQDVTTVEDNEVLVEPEPPVDDANSSGQATSMDPNNNAMIPNSTPAWS